MQLNIHDSTLKRVGFINNNLPDALHYFDDNWHRYLAEGTSTFDFSVNKINSSYALLTLKSYISFTYDGEDYLFNIINIEQDHYSMHLQCENLNLELISEEVGAYGNTKRHSIVWYLKNVAKITDDFVEIGNNPFPLNDEDSSNPILSFDSTDTKLARIISICNSFNAEFQFRTQLKNDGTLQNITIDLYKEEGVGQKRKDVTLYYGKNIAGITSKADRTSTFFNATTVTDSKNKFNWLSVEGKHYNSDGQLEFYKNAGDNTAYAPLSRDMFPSQLKSSSSDRYTRKNLSIEATSANGLWDYAVSQFKLYAYPQMTYEVVVSVNAVTSALGNDKKLNIGDTIIVQDSTFDKSDGGLILSARVSQQEISFTNPLNNKITFTNFVKLKSEISADLYGRMKDLVDQNTPYKAEVETTNGLQFKNGKGSTTLTARIYFGSDSTETKADSYEWRKDGTLVANVQEITVDASGVVDKAVYSFKATVGGKVVASQSVTITNVNDGADGKTPYFHTAWSYSADGTDRFTTTYPNLNLLEGSKDFSGGWWLVERSENDGIYKGLTVKKSEGPGITKQFIAPKEGIYTFSAYVKSSGNNANIIRAVTLNNVTGKIVPDKSMGINFGWLRDSFQVTLKAGDKIYAQYNVAGSGVLWNAGHKWEEGSAATDDLTSNYPNLNLLEGSKKYTKDNPRIQSSSANDGWTTVDDVFVKNLKAGTYTMSGKADAPWTNHDTSGANKGKVGLWLVSTTPGLGVNISLGETVPKTIEVPKDGDYCVRVNTYSNGKDIEAHKFWDFKLEPGSIATPWMPSKNELQEQLTPWMPSLSEVTTADYPSYIGQYTDFIQYDSAKPSDYTWSLIRGNDGKDGATGKDGVAGKDGVGIKTTVITYALSSSGTDKPNTGWTSQVPTLVKGQYLWTKTVWTYTDSSSETGYSVTYIAKDGNNGNDGIAGKDGVGIKKTTITYAVGTSGTTAPASGWNSQVPNVPAGQFLWTKTVWTYTDNTSETGYSVAMMGVKGDKGDPGNNGTNGIAGKDGKGIKATAITYQASPNGTTAPTGTWSASVPPVAKGSFLWTRTIWTYTDNTTETGYAVAYMGTNGNNGHDGFPGKDGTGIKTTTITYAGSTSGTTPPNNGWTSTVPTVAEGNYLWTKTVWTYTDNTSETGYSVAMMGVKGDKGDPGNNGTNGIAGKDGKGIKATAITYQASPNGTTAPTGTWSASVPPVAKGSFLWTRTIWTYTDNTTETGYAVAYMGTNGNNGHDGFPGKDGTGIKTTTITYAGSTSGTTPPNNGWTSTVPTVAEGNYLWTKTVWTYTDNTSETGYSVAMMGVKGDKGDPGNNGTNGIAGKDGKGIKATAITYQASPNGTTAPTGTWSASVPPVAKGSFLWTRTIWTYTDNTTETGYAVAYMGTNGNNGHDGFPGKDGTGIKTTTITYAGSTSGTTPPNNGWTSTVPTVAEGNYLWTKTVWTYTDNTSETGYSVAMMGVKGDKGDPGNNGTNGIAGKDGKGIKATAITYQASPNGTTAPTGTWSASVPPVAKGSFLWTRTIWTYTDNTTETGYAVAYMGTNGNNGHDGFPGKDGTGIKTTTITYAGSTSGTTPPNNGWTSTVPTVAEGNYLWTKTVWAYTDNSFETGYSVGKMGNTGPAGSNGNPGKVVSDTEPTTKFKGLTWKYSGVVDMPLGNGTKILAGTEYYWNGNNWALYEINAHNINGDNLSVTNGTFKDGKIESIWGSNGVNGTTTIEGSHLQIHSSDSTTNTENTLAIDNRQGYAQVYTERNTGRAITVQASFQGFFVSDSTGPFVRVTPNGIKTSSDKSYNSFQIGAGITINLERRGDIVEATLSGSINYPLTSHTKFSVGLIPVGYRPNRTAYIMVHMTGSINSSHIDVEPNGVCTWWGTSTNTGAPRGCQMWFTDDPLLN
ncbi:tail protein [Lactococcus phage BK5-T]|uniref:Receptor-binding protein of phage tail base-plate Siphoviridae head domain-containing protein n=1 Tax=Lactococcus phage BK5-T TaxID=31754 RepID=Q38319_9CAUD|nr:tail protein [Lactococcus phage BK5-T]YP_010133238.1 tail protein [Lactococcus phage BK5-T]AAA98579.1 unknown [Lactococcus phage BK5-T]CAC80159.1 hypothetical protein [Lactococcus phage BK5-T]